MTCAAMCCEDATARLEEAVGNSNDQMTQEFAAKMMALADGPPALHDLDVAEDLTY